MADMKTMKNFLRDEIGLAGEEGLSISKIWELASSSLAKDVTCQAPISLLTELDLEADREYDTLPPPPLDSHLKRQLWKLIQEDNDLRIGQSSEGHGLTLDEIEACRPPPNPRQHVATRDSVSTSSVSAGAHKNGSPVASKRQRRAASSSLEPLGHSGGAREEGKASRSENGSASPTQQATENEWRVFASSKLIWNAIAGHDEDFERVSHFQWRLLVLIASSGPNGIPQPELVSRSEQDKRSVPSRTYSLAEKGYIVKRPITLPKCRTSLLILKRFTQGPPSYSANPDEKTIGKISDQVSAKSDDQSANLDFNGFDLTAIVQTILRELKGARNGVLLRADLRKKMGFENNSTFNRIFKMRIRRLEQIGCLRRIRVPVFPNATTTSSATDPSTGSKPSKKSRGPPMHKCLKYERDLEPSEWVKALQKVEPTNLAGIRDVTAEDDSDNEEIISVENAMDIPQNRPKDSQSPADDVTNAIDLKDHTLPLWAKSDLPRLIFDLVKAAGLSGILSMDLIRQVGGPFMYRPLEKVLSRLASTDLSLLRPSLRHLSIVRHADQIGRASVYKYWTRASYEEMLRNLNLMHLSGLPATPDTIEMGDGVASELYEDLDEKGFEILDFQKENDNKAASFLKAQSFAQVALVDCIAPSVRRAQTSSNQEVLCWERPKPEQASKRQYGGRSKKTRRGADRKATQVDPAADAQGAEGITPIVPARKRGRPRKTKDNLAASPNQKGTEAEPQSVQGPSVRKRGRPPKKNTQAKETLLQADDQEIGESPSPSEHKVDEAPLVANGTTSPISVPMDEIRNSLPSELAGPKNLAQRLESHAPDSTVLESREPSVTSTSDSHSPHEPNTPYESAASEPKLVDAIGANNQLINGDESSKVLYFPPESTPMDLDEVDPATSTKGSITPCEENLRFGRLSGPRKTDPKTTADINAERGPEVKGQQNSDIRDQDSIPNINSAPLLTPVVSPSGEEKLIDAEGVELEVVSVPNLDKAIKPHTIYLQLSRESLLIDMIKEVGDAMGMFRAFDIYRTRYKEERAGAGTMDRKTFNGIADSITRKNLYRQIAVSTQNQKGRRVLGKIIASRDLSLSSKEVEREKNILLKNYSLSYLNRSRMGKIIRNERELPIEVVSYDRIYPPAKKQQEAADRQKTKRTNDARKATLQRIKMAASNALAQRQAETEAQAGKSNYRPILPRIAQAPRMKAHALDHARGPDELRTRFRSSTLPQQVQSRHHFSQGLPLSRGRPQAPNTCLAEFYRKGPLAMINTTAIDFRHEFFSSGSDDSDSDGDEGDSEWEGEVTKSKSDDLAPAPFEIVWDRSRQTPSAPIVSHNPNIGSPTSSILMSGYMNSPALRNTFSRAPEHPKSSMGDSWAPMASRKLRKGKALVNRKTTEGQPHVHRYRIKTSNKPKEPEPRKSNPKPKTSKATKMLELERVQNFKGTDLEESPGSENVFRKDSSKVIPRPRRNRRIDTFDDKTLTLAVIISRALFGGPMRTLRWDVVRKVMPDLDDATLKRNWVRIRTHEKVRIDKLQRQFDKLYLEGLENGELPLYEKDNPDGFDLDHHISWFNSVAKQTNISDCIDLPLNRATFDKEYHYATISVPDWREPLFNVNSSTMLRKDKFISHTFCLPCFKPSKITINESIHDVKNIKRAVKALLLTDDKTYKKELALDVLGRASDEVVKAAFSQLGEEKLVINAKGTTRIRNHSINAKFFIPLKTAIADDTFEQALRFDKTIRRDFANNGELEVSALISNGIMAWTTDMLAARKVKLDFGKTGLKHSSMGLLEGYITRGMDADLHNFDLVLRPLKDFESYQPACVSKQHTDIPLGGLKTVKTPLCIWQDSNEKVIVGMWLKVLKSILAILVLRPGVTEETVQSCLSPLLNRDDAKRALDWLAEAKAVKKGDCGGYTPCSKFYSILNIKGEAEERE